MAKTSKIAWTNGTFNPWRGCTKVSEACRHCYAEGWAKRTGKNIWGPDAAREHAAESYWKNPEKWNEEAAASGKPFRVFCSSLADVCEDREDLRAPRHRLMELIEKTPALTWLLCTKRPENFTRLFWGSQPEDWPKNIWAMTTTEDQEQADKRLPHLLKVPAAVRGVSYEPALGPVDFTRYLGTKVVQSQKPIAGFINWIIYGGESGGLARPNWLEWARSTKAQCREADIAFFFKQLGARPIFHRDESQPLRLGPKGDDPARFPEDLRVQEFPA